MGIRYRDLEGKDREMLMDLRYEIEAGIRHMGWMLSREERRGEKEKLMILDRQLDEMARDFRRMTDLMEQILYPEENSLWFSEKKEERHYYS